MGEPAVYTLHYFPFSLYSLMVRFGTVLGEELSPETAPKIQIELVNMQIKEHLSEPYLTNVNPRGQVPSLTSPALEAPINESYDIAKWLCKQQPQLVPSQHEEAIHDMMDKLYSFHAKALVISPELRKGGVPNEAAAMLENPDLSPGHRRALEIKSVFHDTFHSRTVEETNIEKVEGQARELIGGIVDLIKEYGNGKKWIFGDKPTILDAHAAVFMMRMVDCKRFDLMGDEACEYATRVRESDEWNITTNGRRTTLYDASLGLVAELKAI